MLSRFMPKKLTPEDRNLVREKYMKLFTIFLSKVKRIDRWFIMFVKNTKYGNVVTNESTRDSEFTIKLKNLDDCIYTLAKKHKDLEYTLSILTYNDVDQYSKDLEKEYDDVYTPYEIN